MSPGTTDSAGRRRERSAVCLRRLARTRGVGGADRARTLTGSVVAGVALLTGLALLLRLIGLDREAFWYDEVVTAYRASAATPAGVLARTAADVQAPLYDLFTWALGHGFGRWDALALRWPSALAGAAAVGVVAHLVWRLPGTPAQRRAAAVFAAAAVATAPFLIRQSQEARPYPWMLLCATGALSALIVAHATRGRRGLGVFALLLVALALLHYYGVLAALGLAALAWLNAARFAAHLGRLAWSVVPLVFALVAWSPAALRQFALRDISDVYAPVGPRLLGDLTELASPGALLAVPRAAIEASVWWPATLAGPLRAACMAVFALLVLAGVRALAARGWRGRRAVVAACPPRGAAACLLAAGCSLLAASLWLPQPVWSRLAAALFKGGRAPDAENLAFIGTVRVALGWQGLLLAVLGLLAAFALPALARRGPRLSRAALVAGALILPLAFLAVLELSGKRTYVDRNLVVVLAPLLAVAAVGWSRGGRLFRGATAGVLLVALAATWPLRPTYAARQDWPAAMEQVVAAEAQGATVITYPPWLARCVEYHGGRPWHSLYGSWSAEAVEAWAAQRSAVVLVVGHAEMSDASALRAVLAARFGAPQRHEVRGLTCEVYARR